MKPLDQILSSQAVFWWSIIVFVPAFIFGYSLGIGREKFEGETGCVRMKMKIEELYLQEVKP